ncbi:MAG: methyl-viologen-reducing hydrogenase subunit delta [Burkholderiales bacterium]|nr:methyl-viologen-reducing hydrogenase subunit delta [Burkholderiales bacterium]
MFSALKAHLGGLGFVLFWALAASGIYLYIRFDTSVGGAYASIGEMEWWFGGVLRSLHRYAADAFVVVTMAHLVKELWQGRFRGFRAFSWISGVPLVWLLYASGIVGYWLVWDARAQFSFLATLESVQLAPLGAKVSDRLFSFFVFLHIGLPLALLAAMWIHVQRLGRPRTGAPRALAAMTVGSLLVLALVWPVASEPAEAATSVAIDWFLLFAHPLMYATSPAVLWTALLGITLVLVAVPYLAPKEKLLPAIVDPANCNGCGRCVADCPYEAVIVKDGKASVFAERCAACGICAGACPSSTPFRSVQHLSSGIDLPDMTVDSLKRRVKAALPAGELVFHCETSKGPGLAVRCIAMLPPSFIEYALRNGAGRVRAVGCAECAYRLGMDLADERFARARMPRLRPNVRYSRSGHEYSFALR